MDRKEIKKLMLDAGFVFKYEVKHVPDRSRGMEDVYYWKDEGAYPASFRVSKVTPERDDYGVYLGRGPQYRRVNAVLPYDIDVADEWAGNNKPLAMWTGDNLRSLIELFKTNRVEVPDSNDRLQESGIGGHVEATIDFGDKRLVFDSEVAGRKIPFNFRGVDYEIIFPEFDYSEASDDSHTHKKPWTPTFSRLGLSMNWNRLGTMYAGRYGSVGKFNEKGFRNFYLSCIVVRSSRNLLNLAAVKASRDLEVWRDRVVEWIGAIGMIDLEDDEVCMDSKDRLELYFVPMRRESGAPELITGNLSKRTIRVKTLQSINLDLLGKVLAAIDNRASLPPRYYTTLLSAIKLNNRRDYRGSLLNASTAIEMALTELLDRRLAVINPEQRGLIMRQTKQIGNLVKALRMTGLVVANDIQEKIANPRNGSIHRGALVDKATSDDAIAVAKSFIQSNLPITNAITT